MFQPSKAMYELSVSKTTIFSCNHLLNYSKNSFVWNILRIKMTLIKTFPIIKIIIYSESVFSLWENSINLYKVIPYRFSFFSCQVIGSWSFSSVAKLNILVSLSIILGACTCVLLPWTSLINRFQIQRNSCFIKKKKLIQLLIKLDSKWNKFEKSGKFLAQKICVINETPVNQMSRYFVLKI